MTAALNGLAMSGEFVSRPQIDEWNGWMSLGLNRKHVGWQMDVGLVIYYKSAGHVMYQNAGMQNAFKSIA